MPQHALVGENVIFVNLVVDPLLVGISSRRSRVEGAGLAGGGSNQSARSPSANSWRTFQRIPRVGPCGFCATKTSCFVFVGGMSIRQVIRTIRAAFTCHGVLGGGSLHGEDRYLEEYIALDRARGARALGGDREHVGLLLHRPGFRG